MAAEEVVGSGPNYGAIAGGASIGLGLLDLFFGGGGREFDPGNIDDYDIDRGNLALQEFNIRNDPRSARNLGIRRHFGQVAQDAAPTLDTLLGVNKASGISGYGSSSLANLQRRDATNRAIKQGTQAYQNYSLADQQQAAQFLNMHFQNKMFQQNSWLKANELALGYQSDNNLGDQLLGLGGGLLSKFLI